jgi:hypothetical protein
MAAELLMNERHLLDERSFVEIVIWHVPASVPASEHEFKYRLAFVVDGACVLRYDNESGKGDHRHIGDKEEPYVFTTHDALLKDFWDDVSAWRPR